MRGADERTNTGKRRCVEKLVRPLHASLIAVMEICRAVRPIPALGRYSFARARPERRQAKSGPAFCVCEWPGTLRAWPLRVLPRTHRRGLHTRYRDRSSLLQSPLHSPAFADIRPGNAVTGVDRVMKCAHPDCNRGIGLVSYRRPFAKARYCSKQCRDSYASENMKLAADHHPATYFEWLFLQPPSADPLPQLAHSAARMKRR